MRNQDSRRTTSRRGRVLWAGTALEVLAVAGVSVMAPAVSAQAATGTTQRVVEVVTRAPFGKMLATLKGRSLYTTTSPCTGSCLVAWPPLLMASGKTTPTGVTGLGTVALTFHGVPRLQVTYHGSALYKFVSDSGTSVNGNGVGGFKVAKVSAACP